MEEKLIMEIENFNDWVILKSEYINLDIIKNIVDIGDLKKSKLRKDDYRELLMEQKTIEEIYQLDKVSFGVTSAMVQEKFNISTAQRRRLTDIGVLKVVGTYTSNNFPKKVECSLYDAEQYFDYENTREIVEKNIRRKTA